MKAIPLVLLLALACANVQKSPAGYWWGDQVCRDHGQPDDCYDDALWELGMSGTDELLHGPW